MADKTKLPWMPLYPIDLIFDYRDLSNEEFGILMRIALLQWIHGPIKKDSRILSQNLNITKRNKAMKKLQNEGFISKLKLSSNSVQTIVQTQLGMSSESVKNEFGLGIEWVSELRQKQEDFHKSLSEAGKKGAKLKKEKKAGFKHPESQVKRVAQANQSQSQSQIYPHIPSSPGADRAESISSHDENSPEPDPPPQPQKRASTASDHAAHHTKNWLVENINKLGKGSLEPGVAFKLAKNLPHPLINLAYGATNDARGRDLDTQDPQHTRNYAEYFVGTCRALAQQNGYIWPLGNNEKPCEK